MRLPIRPHKFEPDIVQFRAAGRVAILSPRHQQRAVEEQRRRVKLARVVEVARVSPCPGGRVVQFRAGKNEIGRASCRVRV